MKIYNGIPEVALSNTAVAIGVFDGVHRGHQSVLRHASGHYDRAYNNAAISAHGQVLTSSQHIEPCPNIDPHTAILMPVALTFDIHPMRLVSPERAPGAICSLDQRFTLIDNYGGGIQAVVVAHFDHAFASLSPNDFVKEILIGRLGASHVYVGTDFRYGHGRKGTIDTLRDAGARFGFDVNVAPPLNLMGERISSSRVRRTIEAGDIALVREMLGHEFKIAGTVVPGKQLGRQMGFPTANIHLDDPTQLLPVDGVYGGYAILPYDGSSRIIRSAISVGTNPTTDIEGIRKVEAYIMDGFNEDIYDMHIELDINYRLRGQAIFGNLDDLIRQIREDVTLIENSLPLFDN